MTDCWKVTATIRGSFRVADGSAQATSPPVPGLTRYSLDPEYREDGTFAGSHRLEVDLCVPSDWHGGQVLEQARTIVNHITAIASFAAGQPVRGQKVTASLPLDTQPPSTRTIIGVDEYAEVGPPFVVTADMLAAPSMTVRSGSSAGGPEVLAHSTPRTG